MPIVTRSTVPLPQGKITTALSESPTIAGTSEAILTLDCDAVLVSVYVSVVSGTFDLEVVTETEPGKEKVVTTFPSIAAPTAELVIRKAATVLGNLRIRATYTGACTYEVRVKGIGQGETTVKLVGANGWSTGQVTIGTTPVLLIPASVNDRQGVVIKNWSVTTDVFVAESAAACSVSTCWPLAPRDVLALDVNAGAEVWARTSSGTSDVRISQAGD